MKDSVKVLLLVATMVSGIVSVYAQPGPPGGGNNQGGGNGNGNFGGGNNGNGNGNGNPGVPLDGGLTLLLGAGGAVAYKTMKKKKEQI